MSDFLQVLPCYFLELIKTIRKLFIMHFWGQKYENGREIFWFDFLQELIEKSFLVSFFYKTKYKMILYIYIYIIFWPKRKLIIIFIIFLGINLKLLKLYSFRPLKVIMLMFYLSVIKKLIRLEANISTKMK